MHGPAHLMKAAAAAAAAAAGGSWDGQVWVYRLLNLLSFSNTAGRREMSDYDDEMVGIRRNE